MARAGLIALAGSLGGVALAPAASAQPASPSAQPQFDTRDRAPVGAAAPQAPLRRLDQRDPEATLAVANYGFQKLRVGVRRADGSYLPRRSLAGARIAVVESGVDVDLLPRARRSFVCTTDATGFCPDIGLRQVTDFLASLSGGPAYTGPRPNLLLPDDHATITQLRRPDVPGLAPDPDPLRVGPCLATPAPAQIQDYFCGTTTHVYRTRASGPESSTSSCRPGDDVGVGRVCLPATPAVLVDHHPPPRPRVDHASVHAGRATDVDVLANDRFFGLPTELSVGRVRHGLASVRRGVVRYVAAPAWGGVVRIPYSVRTSTGVGHSAVFVRVEAPPLTRPDRRRDALGRIPIDVLRNDDAEHGGRLALVHVVARHGHASVQHGRVVYVPNPGFTGTDTVSYVVANRYGRSRGEVSIEVTASAASAASAAPLESPASTAALADTGADPAGLVGLALALLVAGASLGAAGRRPRARGRR